MGLEPTRSCDHRHLKPARLPIPPLLHFLSCDSHVPLNNILPDDSESVNSFFQIFSKNFKFSFLPRKARLPQGFSGDPASPGLPAGNCRQQRKSEENTEIRNIEHKSAELLRSKPETDIVGHVTSLMPVIPVRHAAANRKRKP